MSLYEYLIRLWQKTGFIRDSIGMPRCRFYPSCSEYSLEVVKTFGFFKGGIFSLKRLLRCNPLFGGGIDHIPRSLRAKRSNPN